MRYLYFFLIFIVFGCSSTYQGLTAEEWASKLQVCQEESEGRMRALRETFNDNSERAAIDTALEMLNNKIEYE